MHWDDYNSAFVSFRFPKRRILFEFCALLFAPCAYFREDGYVIDRYAVTPKMSTYLVAFAIGDMEFLETATGTTQVIGLIMFPAKTKMLCDLFHRNKF